MKWESYLEFTLSLNLIGIIGFLFMVIFEYSKGADGINHIPANNYEALYWIGYILSLV